jgi:hypothetical protein
MTNNNSTTTISSEVSTTTPLTGNFSFQSQIKSNSDLCVSINHSLIFCVFVLFFRFITFNR